MQTKNQTLGKTKAILNALRDTLFVRTANASDTARGVTGFKWHVVAKEMA